jgi:hypothetical protein
MSTEHLVEWGLAGETEVLGENMPQCYFMYHKSHMTWLGLEHGPSRWNNSDSDNNISCSFSIVLFLDDIRNFIGSLIAKMEEGKKQYAIWCKKQTSYILEVTKYFRYVTDL